MTKDQALKEARRRFGKAAVVQDKGWEHASNPADREAARAEVRVIAERIKILKARQDELHGAMRRFQYSIGKVSNAAGLRYYHDTAEGDSWEACFAELDRKATVIEDEKRAVSN